MAVGTCFSRGAAALPPPLPCIRPAKLRHLQAAQPKAAEPISISTAASPIRLLPGEIFWWEDSRALSGPCCAGTTLLYKLTNKLNQLNCFKFSLLKWPFTVVWVHRSYPESFNCTSLDNFCFVMLMKFLFDLLSQRILANSMLSSAPGGLFGSGATMAFLGSKPGFFWSSECICICSLVCLFPYLCLYYVTIQGIPALVPCLYGAQKMTLLWACDLCGGQNAPERVARDCCKDLNVVFCSPKRNACCRSSCMLK